MTQRLHCLDGLRGVLALYVLVSHMAAFTVLPWWVRQPFTHGEAAVDVFFILSGLVIIRSLNSFGHDRGRFLLARAARTMPAFLVVFAVAVAVQPLPTALPEMPWVGEDDPGRVVFSSLWPAHWAAEIGAHLTMTHGLFPAGLLPYAWVSFLGSSWSLSTEWQFYAVIALLAPIIRDRGTAKLPMVFILLAIAGLTWERLGPAPWLFSKAFLANKSQYFALGIASSALTGASRARERRRFAAVIAATLIISYMEGGSGKTAAPLVWTACLAAQAGWRLAPLRLIAAVLRTPVLLRAGAASYCLYLVNEPVQKMLSLVFARLAAGDGVVFTLLWVPGAIGLPIWLGWLLHQRVEQPVLAVSRARLLAARLKPLGAEPQAVACPTET